MNRYLKFLVVLLIFVTYVSPANAARTNLWQLEDIKTWLEGDFRGSGLTSDGTVKPTISTSSTELPARMAWGSVSTDNKTLIGTSFPSAVYQVSDSGEPTLLHKTNDLGFTAIGKINGTVFAAASPSGSIYRFDSSSDTLTKVTTISDSYIWTMKPDRDNDGLYLGTGSNGNLYHLTPDGTVEKRSSIPGHNVMSLAFYNGELHVGSDDGGIYRIGDDNEPKSIYGFDGGEVSSLAANDEYLYVAVNQRQQSQREENEQQNISKLAEQLKQEALQEEMTVPSDQKKKSTNSKGSLGAQTRTMMIQKIRSQAQRESSSLFAGLNGSIVYRMKPPERMNVVYNDREEIVHDLASDGENLFVATGGKGRLYKVTPDFTRIAYFKTDQRLVLNMQLDDGNLRTVTTGEGGALHRRDKFQSGKVYYRSNVLDAQLLAQWGLLETVGNEDYQIRTRSGNTNKPDTYWSSWSNWQNPPRFDIPSPSARFLQFEVRFLKPQAQLRKLDIAFQIPNQRPRIADLSVSSNPIRKQFIQNRDATQGNGSGPHQSSQSSSDQAINGMPVKKRTVSWKIIDPDGDPTESRLYYRPLGATKWIPFTEKEFVDENEYTIDLRELPDGHYRLKLVTSDKRFNDPKFGFKTEKKSSPILVDNTQPEFKSFSVSSDAVQFTAVDDVSRILLAQYRVNGQEWRALWPDDNIFDQSREVFNLAFSPDVESGDIVEFRLLDEGGNQALTRRTVP